MRIRLSAVLGAALVCLVAAAPRQTAPATGLIVGHVVDGTTGKPVGGVVIALSARPPANAPPPAAPPPTPTRVLVDDTGGFVFASLPAGSYTLRATKRGYVEGAYLKLRPNGGSPSLDLDAGAKMTDVTLRVWKYASIAGTVLDEAGDPVVGVTVHALRRDWVAGHRRLGISGSAVTDDRGMFRVGSLFAGDYVVAVPATQTTVPADVVDEFARGAAANADLRRGASRMAAVTPPGTREQQRVGDFVLQGSSRSIVTPGPAADGKLAVYPTTYYPDAAGAGAADAAVLSLGSGDAKTVPALRLRPVETVRVRGTLTGPAGPAAFTPLRLLPQADDLSSEFGFETAMTMTDARGAFTFLGVTPGRYVLRASKWPLPADAPAGATPPVSTEPTLWLADAISVGDQDLDLSVSLKLGLRVSGRFAFEGQRERPTADQMRRAPVTLEPADARTLTEVPPTQRADLDGGFAILGVSAGRYVLRAGGVPPGWVVKSITVQGRDAIDAPFDVEEDVQDVVITFTDRPTEVRGVVRTAAGAPDPAANVVILPTNPQRWVDFGRTPQRLKNARPAAAGTFVFTGLPPGDYFIVAINDAAATAGQDPRFLETISRLAVRIHLEDGTKLTQDLKTSEIRK
jgi:hypothetical protein